MVNVVCGWLRGTFPVHGFTVVADGYIYIYIYIYLLYIFYIFYIYILYVSYRFLFDFVMQPGVVCYKSPCNGLVIQVDIYTKFEGFPSRHS